MKKRVLHRTCNTLFDCGSRPVTRGPRPGCEFFHTPFSFHPHNGGAEAPSFRGAISVFSTLGAGPGIPGGLSGACRCPSRGPDGTGPSRPAGVIDGLVHIRDGLIHGFAPDIDLYRGILGLLHKQVVALLVLFFRVRWVLLGWLGASFSSRQSFSFRFIFMIPIRTVTSLPLRPRWCRSGRSSSRTPSCPPPHCRW